MSQPKFYFEKRKSLADFTSENMPNQILCSCLRANSRLPDETILNAFNEAYPVCISVLADVRLANIRSADLVRMSANESRSSLLHYCFVYFLLSFHEKAPELRHYLANLKEMLEARLPDIFKPIMLSAASLAPMLPGSVVFETQKIPFVDEQPALNDSKQYVKIQNLMLRAEQLPKLEATAVLQVIRATIADESGDWDTILALAIERVSQRPNAQTSRSPYHIEPGQITNFIKIMKAVFDLHIFFQSNGLYATNFEDFIYTLCDFLNTPIKTPPHGLLSSAKQTKSYMEVFNKLILNAQTFYESGEALVSSVNKARIHDRSQILKLPFNET